VDGAADHRNTGSDSSGTRDVSQSPLIICDRGEERSAIPQRLREAGCVVEVEHLPAGDYLVSAAFAVERKAKTDFVNSLKSRNLFVQLERMSEQYEYSALLIEGDSWEGDRTLKRPLLGELYYWISHRRNIDVIYSPSPAFTASLLADFARREQFGEGRPPVTPSRIAPVRNPRQLVLAFPGVGAAGAEKLLDRFGTVRAITQAAEHELQQTIGTTRGAKLYDLLNKASA
jgi:ERCC4-type nuclease